MQSVKFKCMYAHDIKKDGSYRWEARNGVETKGISRLYCIKSNKEFDAFISNGYSDISFEKIISIGQILLALHTVVVPRKKAIP